jgi:hypothetical protein
MEKIQLNPLEIAASLKIQTKMVRSLITKLQYKPHGSEKIALYLEVLCDIPPAVARLIASNMYVYYPIAF